MSNMFFAKQTNEFSWDKLGDISKGRENLGELMPVLVYRLLEYSMNDVLTQEFGVEKASELFFKSGRLVGIEFTNNVMDKTLEPRAFFSMLEEKLIEYKMGILRIEKFNYETGEFVLTIDEDLDCSGLPSTDEMVCQYDEGFLSGIMEAYTNNKYIVEEIDCWASGARVCRFRGYVKGS